LLDVLDRCDRDRFAARRRRFLNGYTEGIESCLRRLQRRRHQAIVNVAVLFMKLDDLGRTYVDCDRLEGPLHEPSGQVRGNVAQRQTLLERLAEPVLVMDEEVRNELLGTAPAADHIPEVRLDSRCHHRIARSSSEAHDLQTTRTPAKYRMFRRPTEHYPALASLREVGALF